MIKYLIKINFSKLSKPLIFEDKNGIKLMFSKTIPEKNMLKKAKDPNQIVKIEIRLQLLY